MNPYRVWNSSVERVVIAGSIRDAEFYFVREYGGFTGSCPMVDTPELRREIDRWLDRRRMGLHHGPMDWPFWGDLEWPYWSDY